MRIVFMGTPEFAAEILKAVMKLYPVVLIVSQPDKKKGRDKKIDFSPVKKIALESQIPIFQPENIKEDYQEILDAKPDLILTCAYGQIIPQALLNLPRYRCVNIHASLLPKLRGGAPIHKAIVYGCKETGITLMHMGKRMDAGDILWQESLNIEFHDTASTLHDKLIILSKEMLEKYLPLIFKDEIKPLKQEESKATFAYNITRNEERINWKKSSLEIYNLIRGLYSWPLAYTMLKDLSIKIHQAELIEGTFSGEPGKILSEKELIVKTGDGALKIIMLQPAGKKVMSSKDFLNGNKVLNEDCFK